MAVFLLLFFLKIFFQVGRLKEMVAMGMNVDLLQKNGILVDTEVDEDDSKDGDTEENDKQNSQNVRFVLIDG